MADVLSASLPALVGTLAGVLVGQLSTMWWDRRKRRIARDQRRADARESIADELASIREYLRDADYDDPDESPSYPTAAFDSSVASGDFSLLAAATRREVSTAYGLVERVREAEDTLVRAKANDEADSFLRRRYSGHRERLLEHLDGLIEDLRAGESAADGTGEPTGVVA